MFWAAKDLGTSRVEPPVLGSRGEVAASRHTMVFTDAEIEQCTRMRTPNLVHNLKTGVVHLAIRCCGKNRCSNPHGENTNDAGPNLRDNLRDCKVGFKSSRDGGQTWGDWQIVSGPNPGYGPGSPLYDTRRNRIVLQYQSFLSDGGNTKPTSNTNYFQIIVKSWFGPHPCQGIIFQSFENHVFPIRRIIGCGRGFAAAR